MTSNPLGIPLCEAGRTAFFGGRWRGISPCQQIGRNRISGFGPPIVLNGRELTEINLCDEHFRQVNAAGLVTMPYAGYQDPDTGAWHPGLPPEMT